jgi:LuxR family maltose regulon positive regulatory protein
MRARALLALGEPSRAERALDLEATAHSVEVAVTAVQLALLRNDAVAARDVLASWPRHGGSWSELNCALAQALVEDAEGDRRAALRTIDEVVAAAEPDGHVLLFLEAGPGAQRLLRAFFRSHPTTFVRRLVRPEHAAPLQVGANTGDFRAPLSERELLVLRYLPSRMAHAEIAEELFVSVNTVKTQVRSIYTKLGARGRKDAIARAEALGLL